MEMRVTDLAQGMNVLVRIVCIRVLAGPLAFVAFVALAAPTAASGHIPTGVVAVDDRVSVFPLRAPLRSAVAVRVRASDQALDLTVARGHAVVVLGNTEEPFLRIDAAGLAVNAASPTAAAAGLLRPTEPSVGRSPDWQLRSSRRRAVWHDARLRSLPSGVRRGEWQIPLVVDGRRVRLDGEIRRVRAPSPWPWLGLGVPFVVAAALLLSRYRSLLRGAAVVFGAAAAAGTLASAATFALASDASAGRWIEGAWEFLFVLIGLAVVALGPADVRAVAGGALGLLGLAVGLTKLPVFLHGIVLGAFPAALTRASVLFAISAGAAAAAVGVAVFFELLESLDESLA
jgi:hypothetical protein